MNWKQIVCLLMATFMISFCSVAKADAVYLEQGKPAPFAGMLLDKRLELKARVAIEQNEVFKTLVDDQYGMINNLHQQNKVLDNKILILENNQESTLTKVLWFIGGAVVGGFVVNEIKN